jgi:hypothetical protein
MQETFQTIKFKNHMPPIMLPIVSPQVLDDLDNVKVEVPPSLVENPSDNVIVEVAPKVDKPFVNAKVKTSPSVFRIFQALRKWRLHLKLRICLLVLKSRCHLSILLIIICNLLLKKSFHHGTSCWGGFEKKHGR